MTDNMKKFLEMISKDVEAGKKAGTLEKDALVAYAKELGVELTEADFVTPDAELSEDELVAIHGGGEQQDWADFNNCSGSNGQQDCFCTAGGGGQADENGDVCACVGYGQGSRGSGTTCICVLIGVGNDDSI